MGLFAIHGNHHNCFLGYRVPEGNNQRPVVPIDYLLTTYRMTLWDNANVFLW